MTRVGSDGNCYLRSSHAHRSTVFVVRPLLHSEWNYIHSSRTNGKTRLGWTFAEQLPTDIIISLISSDSDLHISWEHVTMFSQDCIFCILIYDGDCIKN